MSVVGICEQTGFGEWYVTFSFLNVVLRQIHTEMFVCHLAMTPAEVTEKLGLQQMKERSWYVHPRYVIRDILSTRPSI